MLRPSDYCELKRRFVQFKHDAKTDDFALTSYDSNAVFFELGSVDWDDLLKKEGVTVLLGEPGSGRSYEFKARCQVLLEQSIPAFYLELHRLVSASPTEILDDERVETFQRWQRSCDKAVFFLDAVDEAKLGRVSDFGLALENFSRTLGSCLNRATIFISSRISEWSPEADLRLVAETFSQGITESKTAGNKSKRRKDKQPEIPVYVIAPLKREQVAQFAKAQDVTDVASFVSALDEHHAWEFARRPSDVRFLVGHWNKHGRIGSLTEMLEECLAILLKERDEKFHRSVKLPLSQENARLGAEALAAATIFCRTLDFEIADPAPQSRRPSLKPLDCLPSGWSDVQCKALLDRPLFDSAIYGRVRFHHRRLAEYLAACWLKRRMENQCPTPVLMISFLFCLTVGAYSNRHVHH